MSLLETISQTALIRWVAESDWGYPIVLTAHAIGMGLLVGIQLVFALRVLGVGAQVPLAAIRSYFRFAWFGLVVNVVSGTLLFLINYNQFLHNVAFLTKLSMLVLAGVCTWALTRSTAGADGSGGRARLVAGVSLALWFAVIVAGRLVAYTDVPDRF